jgi:hypothetical protein
MSDTDTVETLETTAEASAVNLPARSFLDPGPAGLAGPVSTSRPARPFIHRKHDGPL